MKFKGISKEEVSAYLLDKGYTVGSNKIPEYIKEGLMMQGLRSINPDSKSYPIYYTPAVLLEFMTASLLHKGNWLMLTRREDHTKLTYRDIYWGRRWFFTNVLQNKAEYHKLFNEIDKLTEISVSSICLNTLEVIPRYNLHIYDTFDAEKAYADWTYWQYKLTFESLYNQHIEEILFLPLTEVKVKEVDYKNARRRLGSATRRPAQKHKGRG